MHSIALHHSLELCIPLTVPSDEQVATYSPLLSTEIWLTDSRCGGNVTRTSANEVIWLP